MSTTYEIMTKAEALVAGADPALPHLAYMSDPDGYDGENLGVFRVVDGVPVALIATDGGEPEDQTFSRDWGWVDGALQQAYNLGATDNSPPMDATPADCLPSGALRKIVDLMTRCAQAMHDDGELNMSSPWHSGGDNPFEAAGALNELADILGIEGPSTISDRMDGADG